MKPVSNEFKQAIKQYGRQIKAEITYNDGEEHLLNSDVLFSVTPTINGNILKSVMKQVDFESSVKVPKNTIINIKFGVKVGEDYEYVNFGNYIVSKEPEYNADTQTYNHICYDKLLYSMKEYQRLDITYPITIREYINQFAQNLGLTFKNRTETFANYDKYIKLDLYDGQGYTFRDVLDELAEVTASTICINEVTDELEIRYLNDTQEIINEDYLKNINVEFAQMYGPINSIVLSRSGESDNVYLQNETSVQLNGLCELKIIDNQIMNDNDRSVFLADILDHLNGITYYINNFDSPGITWLELCDKYTVRIGTNQYNCVLFNNEIKITQGLEETIFTELPVASETDYTKADKTDRKINQTYLIVDKQNQKIESVVSQADAQNQKISVVEQTVNELNSKISDIADITTSKESTNGTVSFEKINQSEPIYIKIYPTGENISYLYPHANLFPSETLFLKVRTLRFTNTTTNEYFDYELPTDLLYYDAENYDEFILDYDAQSCVVNKRVGYNADGTTYVLENPTTIEYEYPRIELTDGDYVITLLGYHNAYLFVRLMAQNIYTTQFATKAELNSEISQTAEEIGLSVDKKLTSYPTTTQMNSAISVKANEITSSVSETYETKSNATTNYSKLTQTANSLQSQISANDKDISTLTQTSTSLQSQITSNDTDISTMKQSVNEVNIEVGKKYNTSDFTNAKITAKINDGTSSVQIKANKIDLSGKTINMTSDNIAIKSTNFSVDKNGNMTCNNGQFTGGKISLKGGTDASPNFEITDSNDTNVFAYITPSSMQCGDSSGDSGRFAFYDGVLNAGKNNGGLIQLTQGGNRASSKFNMYVGDASVVQGNMHALSFLYDSLESLKKNITPFDESALELLKNIDIYEYNFKHENDKDKKHIGFVIGDKYNYSQRVTGKENTGVDNYAYTSLCVKAIQEQQQLIEQLQKEIENLKKESE